jgi:hypothetical protein
MQRLPIFIVCAYFLAAETTVNSYLVRPTTVVTRSCSSHRIKSSSNNLLHKATLSDDTNDDSIFMGYDEEDLVDAVVPASTNDEKQQLTTIPGAAGFVMQVGMVVVLALLGYTATAFVVSGAISVTSSATNALGDEVVREIGNLGSNIWTLLVSVTLAVWEILKVVVPFIGKTVYDAGKAAAPVVGEASTRFVEVATPFVEEAARTVNDVTAPYVDSVAQTVDTAIVGPVKTAVETNVLTPLQGVQNSVTTQIDSTIQDVTQTVSSTIQGVTDGATNTVRETVLTPIQDVTTKVDTTVRETVMNPIQDVTTKVDTAVSGVADSLKDVTKPIRDVLPF